MSNANIRDMASPPSVDAALDQLTNAPAAAEQSTGLWQSAILAIGRRVAAAVGNTDGLAADATSALGESLDFDLCGVATPMENGELSLALSALKFGVNVPTETLTVSDRTDESLIAFAQASGRMIATPHIREETRFHDPLLRRCQAQSALVCPLRSNGANYGAILLASLAPRTLSPAELVCVETISHLVAAALARSRVERLLEQSQITTEVLEAVDAPVVVLDAELRLIQFNRSCGEFTGFSLVEVQQRKFCGVLVASEDEAAVKRVFDQLLEDGKPSGFEAKLLLKHGAERRVEWRFRRLSGNHAGVLVGTGIDVTAKCELEGQLKKLQQASKPTSGQKPAASGAADKDADGANRRRFPRRPYPYVQRMATLHNGKMPPIRDFKEIECRDISAGGFSYYSPTKPTQTALVVAFGVEGMETFLTAQIMHVRPAVRNGKTMYAVGCQYTGRGQTDK